VKVVWHVHTPLHDELSIRTTNMVKFGIIGQAVDRILLVGPEIQEQVRRRLAPRRRMSLFPNGIDFGRFVVPDAQARASARARLGLPIDLPLLVTFAWDWDRKGGPLFLEAIRLLRSRGLRVVGVPVVLDERAAELAQDEGVRPLTPIDDVSDLYAAADVFVAASDAEGMPFSVLEALASGTPVVASDIPSHRFFGDDLPTLRLVQRSPPALAAAIASEIQEEATRQARAASTRTQLQTRFSLSRWADRLVQVYTELMAPEPYLPDRGARAGAREG
jgi:glycosyltransferase involved in cell wall biosynthesis